MRKFKVLFTQAGPFERGAVVTEKQITEAGHSVDHWLGHKSIEEINEVAGGEASKVAAPASFVEQQAAPAPAPQPSEEPAEESPADPPAPKRARK